MHELSIAQSLLETVQTYAPKRVFSIRMKIGALTAVLPDSLTFAFEALRPGTTAESARLVIDQIPVRCSCKACALEFEMERLLFVCPNCGGTKLDVLSGNELDIVELELEE